MERKKIGNLGENLACQYLKNKNYNIRERNYQNITGKRLGELDIIAFDKKADTIVFVEVKTKSIKNNEFCLPEENITYSKLKRLNKIAQSYLFKHNLRNKPFRFDAISIAIDFHSKKAKIRHLKNIFL